METNLLLWPLVPPDGVPGWPEAILTFAPPFAAPDLPLEALVLLPRTEGSRGLLETLGAAPARAKGRAVGLFLTDPFLDLRRTAARLGALGVSWVANLPSVAQHDEDFRLLLSDVGLGVAAEMTALGTLRGEGLRCLAVLSHATDAAAAAAAMPDAVIVVPTVRDLSAGFPSPAILSARVRAIGDALRRAGYTGPVLAQSARPDRGAGAAVLMRPHLTRD